ncbi:hypothetical protein ZIOFF_010925 [Zingiber officinale]|uniref:poly(ADP-ribose) glycohydrolase n=1 Tax=Zingiber officinale TaxID=94328 RepID=A0A8J5LPP3_ZINOF|nr:hypothetical protein ZIOFF_010925 [Zingiber officinale]
METRGDLASILPFLPLVLRSSSLCWPSGALGSLKALALGSDVSRIRSGEVLFDAILDLRESLGLSSQPLAYGSASGFSSFFDELMSKEDSRVWFDNVVPEMARLLLQLPSLLESHYLKSDELFSEGKSGIRIMGPQEPGRVFLSQELIAALLSCAMFCLFPTSDRGFRGLPIINFDNLFAPLYWNEKQHQVQKVKCIIHYFERITSKMLTGSVSFERKVLHVDNSDHGLAYSSTTYWRSSTTPLCPFGVMFDADVFSEGLIEDQPYEAIEVDFANEYFGGGALGQGCVQKDKHYLGISKQEEIRFMINPELIVGMLFLPSMNANEAIEIVGVERFSSYSGYGHSFQFMGDYQDNKPYDSMGRRKTWIVAIDALSNPRMRQYGIEYLVRETNKALCGFFDQSKYKCRIESSETFPKHAKDIGSSESKGNPEGTSVSESSQVRNFQGSRGIATGNWGCGAFGGDPEIKSMIQWLAASEGLRPFIHYYSFGEAALQKLEEATRWILQHGWTVSDLWSMLAEYCDQRLSSKTFNGFFDWLLPCN